MISGPDRRRLSHVVAYARKAIAFLGDLEVEALESDEQKLFAIIRAVEVVGEAAAQVSGDLKKRLPHLPWGPAKAMRNLLIHAYPEVRTKTLVDTVRNDFPPLIAQLGQLLGEEPTA